GSVLCESQLQTYIRRQFPWAAGSRPFPLGHWLVGSRLLATRPLASARAARAHNPRPVQLAARSRPHQLTCPPTLAVRTPPGSPFHPARARCRSRARTGGPCPTQRAARHRARTRAARHRARTRAARHRACSRTARHRACSRTAPTALAPASPPHSLPRHPTPALTPAPPPCSPPLPHSPDPTYYLTTRTRSRARRSRALPCTSSATGPAAHAQRRGWVTWLGGGTAARVWYWVNDAPVWPARRGSVVGRWVRGDVGGEGGEGAREGAARGEVGGGRWW
ncbi:hypothetical protein BD626DRAFT_633837, partial [Schizophyllum amplum]